MAPVKHTKFNMCWLTDSNYVDWLAINEKSIFSAKCKLCMCCFELGNMGKGALNSHSNSKKHQNKVSEYKSKSSKLLSAWSRQSSTSASSPTDPASILSEPDASQISLNEFVIKEDVSKAEIYWTLQMIQNHQSYNSSKHTSPLFSLMFPDSNIAKQFSCGPSKCSYLTTFGLAPYFEQNLYDKIDKVPVYSVSFDESFNRVTKNEQMDLTIRFWDSDKDIVVNRYLGSNFLGHTRSADLLQHFNDATSKLNKGKILQVGMDGPNANIKFHKDLVEEISSVDPELPNLLDIGTCGLHVMHRAFRTGFTASGWKLDTILKSLYYLFNESPARRSDYTTYTSSQVFPLQFCGTRWIEDSSVAERAITIWDDISKYVETITSGLKNKIPKFTSFAVVNKAVNDPTTVSKLHIFI